MKNKKSALDIFKISMIKYVKEEIINGLVIIINKSIEEGVVPDLLKIAKVIPIHNQLITHMRQTEMNYYKWIFDNKKNNIKKLWEHMGQLLTPTKQARSSKSISKLLVSGKEISGDKQIANALHDHFANVGDNLASTIPTCTKSFKDYLKDPNSHSIFCNQQAVRN